MGFHFNLFDPEMDFEERQMALKNKINKMKNIFEYLKIFLFSFTNLFKTFCISIYFHFNAKYPNSF